MMSLQGYLTLPNKIYREPRAGFEPATSSLPRKRSDQAELPRRSINAILSRALINLPSFLRFNMIPGVNSNMYAGVAKPGQRC